MKLKKTLAVINQMQAAGVIGRYAIGGAVGATFYLEPMATVDVDVFVAIHPEPGQLIATPKPIYDYLTARGCKTEGEYLVIEDWPVQFLPLMGPLVEEAIHEACDTIVEGERTFVMTAEHLVAIALQTGRGKDKARILQFLEAGVLDQKRFQDVLRRHRLLDRWTRFEQQFLGGES
ncbi:MAG: hypothetical protein AAB676_08790 [Verrucomicrobiota bacterium]